MRIKVDLMEILALEKNEEFPTEAGIKTCLLVEKFKQYESIGKGCSIQAERHKNPTYNHQAMNKSKPLGITKTQIQERKTFFPSQTSSHQHMTNFLCSFPNTSQTSGKDWKLIGREIGCYWERFEGYYEGHCLCQSGDAQGDASRRKTCNLSSQPRRMNTKSNIHGQVATSRSRDLGCFSACFNFGEEKLESTGERISFIAIANQKEHVNTHLTMFSDISWSNRVSLNYESA